LPAPFLGPYYGNPYYCEKYKYFTNNHDKFNTVIFGTSRLYREMVPKIFDSLLKEYQTSTFNLAAPAVSHPEAYYLYERLLETVETNSLKYSFIELAAPHNSRFENLNTTENHYWHNLKYLNFLIKYTFDSDLSSRRKIRLIHSYIVGYVNKAINLFGYKKLFNSKFYKMDFCLGENKDGFYSLEEQMRDFGVGSNAGRRFTSFLKDTTVLDEKISIANKAFSLKTNKQFINEAHLIKLIELIEKSKQKGIHLIFVMPPGMYDYHEVLAIKERLPSNHIIEIANPKIYPELYQVNFQFDIDHLNKKGAVIFTEYLANEFKKYF